MEIKEEKRTDAIIFFIAVVLIPGKKGAKANCIADKNKYPFIGINVPELFQPI